MEKSLKEQIVKSAEAVKKKVKFIKELKSENDNIIESVFKPITSPLNKIANNTESSFIKDDIYIKNDIDMENSRFDKKYDDQTTNDSDDDRNNDDDSESECTKSDFSNNTFQSISSPRESSSWSMSSEMFQDIPFGIRKEQGKCMMGSVKVSVSPETVTLSGQAYKRTDGLNELLFKKVPNLNLVTENDKKIYKVMLLETNAHRRDYSPSKPIKSNKGKKYLQIIKPLFTLQKNIEAKGAGLHEPMLKKMKNSVDLVYWDDPNELVERLKLLIASQDAGNTGVNNEIIAIIEELRETGYIN